MDINASIIDQRLTSIADDIRQQSSDELHITDDRRLKSVAFVYLCVKTTLDLDSEEVFDCLTEGSGDFGVDAVHISGEHDGEFTVSLFQAKYKNDLSGNANFPESGVKSLINAIQYLFDPNARLEHINDRLLSKVEEARSLIRDGYIPQIRSIACNNGLTWSVSSEEAITQAALGDQVTWQHINHEHLVKILQSVKPVQDTLRLSGKAIVEDMQFSRILVGRISVTEISALIERHGEQLLERNIRRYLGLQGNRVNQGIQDTLISSNEKSHFYFYNNGITLTCSNFSYNALQGGDYQVRVDGLQIINGGQTCMTIFKTLQKTDSRHQHDAAYVLLRLYQLPQDNQDLVYKITYATNSQNPVDLKDLRSNDVCQNRLEIDIRQLGFDYRRKRTDTNTRPTDITSGIAAEAVLSVWREKPHQARFFSREHFGKLYATIFTDQLNGAQVITAVQLYRFAENRRKRPDPDSQDCVRYASCFIAMQMGRKLLADMGIQTKDLNHQNFREAQRLIAEKTKDYWADAVQDIQRALQRLYGGQDISLQQLSATFRRGDLVAMLA